MQAAIKLEKMKRNIDRLDQDLNNTFVCNVLKKENNLKNQKMRGTQ